MENTIELLRKQHWTLVEVIQWMDSNGHSDTEIRSKVDTILNFEKDLKEGSEMELTKISLVWKQKKLQAASCKRQASSNKHLTGPGPGDINRIIKEK